MLSNQIRSGCHWTAPTLARSGAYEDIATTSELRTSPVMKAASEIAALSVFRRAFPSCAANSPAKTLGPDLS